MATEAALNESALLADAQIQGRKQRGALAASAISTAFRLQRVDLTLRNTSTVYPQAPGRCFTRRAKSFDRKRVQFVQGADHVLLGTSTSGVVRRSTIRSSSVMSEVLYPWLSTLFVKPLLQLPLFRGLKPMQITEIIRARRPHCLSAGRCHHRGARRGRCRHCVGGRRGRARERAGFVESGGAGASRVTVTHSECSSRRSIPRRSWPAPAVDAMRIQRTEIREMMTEDPAIADHFVQKITARLTRLADELHSIDSILAGSAAQFAPGPAGTASACQPYH